MARLIALVLTLLTGVSGPVYEVAWQRWLATLLGSHSEATAAVPGIYLGGLGWLRAVRRLTSSLVAARGGARRAPAADSRTVWSRRRSAWAFLFPTLFGLAQSLSFALHLPSPGLAFAVDVLLAAFLIGPPTVLMGGNSSRCSRRRCREPRRRDPPARAGLRVHCGSVPRRALAAAFWRAALGLVGVLRAMGANLFAGASSVVLD